MLIGNCLHVYVTKKKAKEGQLKKKKNETEKK